MTWNIAFSHLCDHVLTKRLPNFDARLQVSFPGMHKGNKGKSIAVFDTFAAELKEQQVLEICRDAGSSNKNIYNIMHAALGKRNAAAHANAVVIDQVQTDAYVSDLMTNVVQRIVERGSKNRPAPFFEPLSADVRYHLQDTRPSSRLSRC
jgi:hypothetical protein